VLDVVRVLQRAYEALGEPFTTARFAVWLADEPPPAAHLKSDTAVRLLGSWSRCRRAAGAAAD
jgi:hypothetical protein